ncbi:MAG: UvrD-helicase domain-containing protein, partial [Pseudomonadota bacterium]
MSKAQVTPDQTTLEKQSIAAHPRNSAWVSANAGSGKTYVLATRVIRLLLDGVDPSKLLCLTFTKTAAAEMKTRVFGRLADWVTMDNAALSKALRDVDGTAPDDKKLAFARTLFASALEAPGGLKIQTIHAFCEALLHRFPLEANIAGHFELIDPTKADQLLSLARRHILSGRNRAPQLVQAVDQILEERGEAGFNDLIMGLIANRRELAEYLAGRKPETLRETYLRAFGLPKHVSRQDILHEAWPLDWFDDRNVAALLDEATQNKRKTLIAFCETLLQSGNGDPEARFEQLLKAFTVDGKMNEGEPPKKPRVSGLTNKDVLAAFPRFDDARIAAAEKLIRVHDDLLKLDDVDQNMRMLTLADVLIERYEMLKRASGYLDFDDLIARTAAMLKREGSSAWVRYKLDQGIDHILVDEAQDTSPLQWEVVKTFADEFFDGEAARPGTRTVFAVGDDKQSIYSFQGADPAGFDDARHHFRQKVAGADKRFEPIDLDRSFRSTRNVLAAVDLVFENETNRKGLTQADNYPKHTALRDDSDGQVVMWDVRTSDKEPEIPDDWTATIDSPIPAARALADDMATHIGRWLDGTEPMAVQGGRPITAGDIVVLVRKRRGAFVGELSHRL